VSRRPNPYLLLCFPTGPREEVLPFFNDLGFQLPVRKVGREQESWPFQCSAAMFLPASGMGICGAGIEAGHVWQLHVHVLLRPQWHPA